MATNEGRLQVRLRQLATKFESCPSGTAISDMELLELYHAVHVPNKIARETAMPEPNLRRLVALCNLCDAIAIGENQLYLRCIRADRVTMYSTPPPQAPLDYKKDSQETSSRLSVASRQCDRSLQFRINNVHLNF